MFEGPDHKKHDSGEPGVGGQAGGRYNRYTGDLCSPQPETEACTVKALLVRCVNILSFNRRYQRSTNVESRFVMPKLFTSVKGEEL